MWLPDSAGRYRDRCGFRIQPEGKYNSAGRQVQSVPMKRLGFVLVFFVAMLAGAMPGASQQTAVVDVSKLGPQVGQRVPDFSLKDQSGRTWTLQSIMGPRGAMLVFFRSADW